MNDPSKGDEMRKPARVAIVTLLMLATACVGTPRASKASLPLGGAPFPIDAKRFTSRVDNPYWPMVPGDHWIYREPGPDGVQKVEITVMSETKKIIGIDAVVVHDKVTLGGVLIEDTLDWYAQDLDGNIWSLGEDTKQYEGGRFVGAKGAWEAGVDGALAGIMIPAHPAPGMTYRQEYYAGQGEDGARVLSIDEFAKVPSGQYRDLLMTRDTTPLDPKILEYKFYAKGVGPVLIVAVSPEAGREELVRFDRV